MFLAIGHDSVTNCATLSLVPLANSPGVAAAEADAITITIAKKMRALASISDAMLLVCVCAKNDTFDEEVVLRVLATGLSNNSWKRRPLSPLRVLVGPLLPFPIFLLFALTKQRHVLLQRRRGHAHWWRPPVSQSGEAGRQEQGPRGLKVPIQVHSRRHKKCKIPTKNKRT